MSKDNFKWDVSLIGEYLEFQFPLTTEDFKNSRTTKPKEQSKDVPHKCKYCGAMVNGGDDEECYANPKFSQSQKSKPIEKERVTVKVMIAPAVPILTDWANELSWYNFTTSKPIDQYKFSEIREAIEKVLNDEDGEEKKFSDRPIFTPKQLEDARRDAFNAAREDSKLEVGRIEYSDGDWSHHYMPKYMDYKDYKSKLPNQ